MSTSDQHDGPRAKMARLDAPDLDDIYENKPHPDTMDIDSADDSRPFSAFLNNTSKRSKRHPVLSDKKLIVYNLQGSFSLSSDTTAAQLAP